MGKKRIITIIEEGVKKKEIKRSLKEKKGVRVPGLKGGERVIAVTPEPVPEEKPAITEARKEAEARKKAKPKRLRGKKYKIARAKIDPTKSYSPKEAIKLAKETSIARFDGTLEAHLITTIKGLKGEVQLPYFVGTSVAFKTEANAPLIHTVFGKTSQKEAELLANFQALINAIGPKKIKKVVICSTMGPGIKVAVDPAPTPLAGVDVDLNAR